MLVKSILLDSRPQSLVISDHLVNILNTIINFHSDIKHPRQIPVRVFKFELSIINQIINKIWINELKISVQKNIAIVSMGYFHTWVDAERKSRRRNEKWNVLVNHTVYWLNIWLAFRLFKIKIIVLYKEGKKNRWLVVSWWRGKHVEAAGACGRQADGITPLPFINSSIND